MSAPPLTPSQRALICDLPSRFAPERIDQLWLFSAQIGKSKESGLVVLSLFAQADPVRRDDGESSGAADPPDRRHVVTIRYEAAHVRGQPRLQQQTVEEGTAPREGIGRVIAGVVSRTGPESPDPFVADIAGSSERWERLLERLGVAA